MFSPTFTKVGGVEGQGPRRSPQTAKSLLIYYKSGLYYKSGYTEFYLGITALTLFFIVTYCNFSL